jgi:hypothetical protein
MKMTVQIRVDKDTGKVKTASYIVRLPKKIVESVGFTVNDTLAAVERNGEIVIMKLE